MIIAPMLALFLFTSLPVVQAETDYAPDSECLYLVKQLEDIKDARAIGGSSHYFRMLAVENKRLYDLFNILNCSFTSKLLQNRG
ncbi:hypothetical protein [Neptunomonas antarctica]|uniref:Uncharacterized protein n=1 Tax=Neptunomonas antarctica TaxID=619304 RepID=A0A1N7J609_9GAMM|nr:hypothetical protein [Neptunomonas antarctica]SIS44676.1 hypothetical protein SAMN05421760_101654 [Neptunomonas antarctica]